VLSSLFTLRAGSSSNIGGNSVATWFSLARLVIHPGIGPFQLARFRCHPLLILLMPQCNLLLTITLCIPASLSKSSGLWGRRGRLRHPSQHLLFFLLPWILVKTLLVW
jgi:hypothetical protein